MTRGEENEELLLNGYRVTTAEGEKLDMDSGNGHTSNYT